MGLIILSVLFFCGVLSAAAEEVERVPEELVEWRLQQAGVTMRLYKGGHVVDAACNVVGISFCPASVLKETQKRVFSVQVTNVVNRFPHGNLVYYLYKKEDGSERNKKHVQLENIALENNQEGSVQRCFVKPTPSNSNTLRHILFFGAREKSRMSYKKFD